jgi:hypothetical protein
MRETFVVGNKEYSAIKIPAFQANQIIMKLQRLVLPVLGGMTVGKSFSDMDTKDAFAIISEKLNESVMTDIVLPMFKLSQVADVGGNFKIDSDVAINKAFGTADNLADMYELIFEVLRFNFGSFFTSLADRFGNLNQPPAATE